MNEIYQSEKKTDRFTGGACWFEYTRHGEQWQTRRCSDYTETLPESAWERGWESCGRVDVKGMGLTVKP